jgi:hypothetical protein
MGAERGGILVQRFAVDKADAPRHVESFALGTDGGGRSDGDFLRAPFSFMR